MYHLIITTLFLGTPTVLKLKVVCLLKLEEKGKLMNIQTLKSKKELELVQ